MRITNAEINNLVGRTFERDGKRRTVGEVEPRYVWWYRAGYRNGRERPCHRKTFAKWLAGATEVTNG